ncbi:hypothetical protein BGZ58_010878 [Dissophora ornata]|nr:hypothetical protein BGZ58_010878 [Dissophora ornata]
MTDAGVIQALKDELEELTESKLRLDDKATQLEKRAQYLEASARLSASKQATEIMDLKEKARKLEIDLSTVLDERDSLMQEKEAQASDAEVLDEAIQLSTQLKDAWLRISNMKVSQEKYVQKLYRTEEANTKLRADLAKAVEASSTAKNTHNDERNHWDVERQEYHAEVSSLKAKLSLSLTDGGKQILDWEQDKARLLNSLKHDRAAWVSEKKGFLDQIASLKVKATALGVQKVAPPEWIVEKHHLVEQCATLQSRVSTLESDRTNRGSVNGSNVKKLEIEKQKLEKKVDALKAKLVEVMQHAITIQDKVDEDSKPGSSQRRRTATRRRKRPLAKEPESDEDDGMVVVEIEEEPQETAPAEAAPPLRVTRAKRSAAVKKVNYQVSSNSSTESEDSEDDHEQGDGDSDGDNDDAGYEKANNENNDMDVDKDTPEVHKEITPDNLRDGQDEEDTNEKDNEENDDDDEDEDEDEDDVRQSSLARSRRATAGKARRAAEDSSDSEFEPPKKTVVVVKGRGKEAVKKTVSPSTEPAPKKPKMAPQIKKRSIVVNVAETKAAPDTASRNTSNEAMPAPVEPSPSTMSTTTSVPTTTMSMNVSTSDAAAPKAVDKVKKKRKLLTGKGLANLGDILSGPGSSLSSTPSTNLDFGKGKARQKSNSSTLLNETGPNPAKMEALNAIKMAFVLPKPRNVSPNRDREA